MKQSYGLSLTLLGLLQESSQDLNSGKEGPQRRAHCARVQIDCSPNNLTTEEQGFRFNRPLRDPHFGHGYKEVGHNGCRNTHSGKKSGGQLRETQWK